MLVCYKRLLPVIWRSSVIMAVHSSDAAPLYISSKRVKELVSVGDVLKAVETGLGAYSRPDSGVVQPVRSVVPVTEHAGFFGVMPAYCPESNSLAAKLITFYRLSKNAEKGLPTHQSIIAVFEPSTGTLLALVDGELLTKRRTAAASAVALKALKGSSNPKILCIVGSGILARSHAEAMKLICQFDEIRVWGRNADHARQCAHDIGDGCLAYERLEEACNGADVLVTVTVSTAPVLCGKWVKEGAIVCGVGACRPDWRETDDDLMKNSLVVADSRAGVEKESGDVVLSGAEVYCEVGELINGTVGPITTDTLKSHNKKFIFFKSLGMGLEDAVTARLVYDKHIQEAK